MDFLKIIWLFTSKKTNCRILKFIINSTWVLFLERWQSSSLENFIILFIYLTIYMFPYKMWIFIEKLIYYRKFLFWNILFFIILKKTLTLEDYINFFVINSLILVAKVGLFHPSVTPKLARKLKIQLNQFVFRHWFAPAATSSSFRLVHICFNKVKMHIPNL